MGLYFVTISVRDRRPLGRDEDERRRIVRALASAARGGLVSFAVADDHTHLILRSKRIAMLARDVRSALARLRPDLELKAPDVEPIDTRTGIRNVLEYQLGQWVHHGLDGHAASATGSCFPDFVEARLLRGFDRRQLREVLPNIRGRELYPMVGLEPRPLIPASDEALRELGVHGLVDLVSAVLLLPVRLTGDTRDETEGRALAAGIVRRLDQRLSDLADVLRITRQAVSQLSRRPLAPEAELAVRLRRALDMRVQERQQRGRAAAQLSEVES